MDPKELAIQSAIADVESGLSQRKAADLNNVARSTLQERLKGRQGHATAHQHQQRLTPEQEDFLADWILSEEMLNQTPSPQCIRRMAARIVRMSGNREPLGQLWVAHFIRRHPRVEGVLRRSAGSMRSMTAGTDDILALLKLSECTQVELGLQYGDLRGLEARSVRRTVQVFSRCYDKLADTDILRITSWY